MTVEDEQRRYTANQIIAHNLRLARQQRGWTQEESARRLEPHLGVRWSKATYSAAERSSERSGRIRQFTADDLLAFSVVFDVPVAYFFLPPIGRRDASHFTVAASDKAEASLFEPSDYLERVFGSREGEQLMQRRLKAIVKRIPPEPDQEKLREATSGLMEARMLEHRDELETWAHALLGLYDVVARVSIDLFHIAQEPKLAEMTALVERLVNAQREREADDSLDEPEPENAE